MLNDSPVSPPLPIVRFIVEAQPLWLLEGRNNIRAFFGEQVRGGSLTVLRNGNHGSKPLILLFVPPFVVRILDPSKGSENSFRQ